MTLSTLKKIFCGFLAGILLVSAVPARAFDFSWKNTFLGIAALATAGYTYAQLTKPKGFDREYWDWQKTGEKIDTESAAIAQKLRTTMGGQDFLWGVATAAHQVEGNCHNSWTEFEKEKIEPYYTEDGLTFTHKIDPKTGTVLMKDLSGNACEHWTRYHDDIKLMKNLGVNSYRFSVEWSKIQPTLTQMTGFNKNGDYVLEYEFNEAALKHYEDVCDELLANGIKPIITLHHYTNPIWFEKLGAFEKEENIKYFVKFCEKVFDRLKDKVHLWITFNSPSGYALNSYYRGVYAPGKSEEKGTGSMQLAIEVTKNMLEAHVQVYQLLKPIKPDAQIGILHHHYPLKPYRGMHPADNFTAYMGNKLTNTSTLEFFGSGKFNVWIPTKANVKHSNILAPKSLDFLGLSFYSHNHMLGKQTKHYDEDCVLCKEVRTDKETFVIYPEGMYHAIKDVAKYLGKTKPIYIAENGTADDECEARDIMVDGTKMTRREFFLRRYLAAIAQAKEDGYDIRGYIHWSLMDNFEWQEGYSKKFGLYEVDFKTQERKMRKGAKYYQKLVHQARGLPMPVEQAVPIAVAPMPLVSSASGSQIVSPMPTPPAWLVEGHAKPSQVQEPVESTQVAAIQHTLPVTVSQPQQARPARTRLTNLNMHATAASASTQKSQTQPIKSGSLSFKDKQKMFESAQS